MECDGVHDDDDQVIAEIAMKKMALLLVPGAGTGAAISRQYLSGNCAHIAFQSDSSVGFQTRGITHGWRRTRAGLLGRSNEF